MIRLVLLLMGADFVRARWRLLAGFGAFSLLAGIVIFIDGLDGVLYFPLEFFGALILIEGVLSVIGALSGMDAKAQNRLRLVKGFVFLLVALMIFDPYPDGNFILAMLFGVIFTIAGLLRISSAWVVRFAHWKLALAAGAIELLLAGFMFEPWPTHYKGALPDVIGVGLGLVGWNLLHLAWRLRRLPATAAISLLTRRGGEDESQPVIWLRGSTRDQVEEMIVHVWTPAGAAEQPLPQPVVDRYIAAVDRNGTISTGHAALEVPPGLYISHYPAVEIDRSPGQFTQTLRATVLNDVRGRFQESYTKEAAGWCESTVQVRFRRYNLIRLRAYWLAYSKDETYNLTNRNCSSTVVHAVETALEGIVGQQGGGWFDFARMLLSPEVWLASQLYRRANTMAWTPGLCLDYVRTLQRVVDPPPVAWLTLLRLAIRHSHTQRPHRAVTLAADSIARDESGP